MWPWWMFLIGYKESEKVETLPAGALWFWMLCGFGVTLIILMMSCTGKR